MCTTVNITGQFNARLNMRKENGALFFVLRGHMEGVVFDSFTDDVH